MTGREDSDEVRKLKRICIVLQWMARRYVDGRRSYATGMFNEITRDLLSFGVELNPCDERIVWARDSNGRKFDGLSELEATPGTPEAMGKGGGL